MLKVYTESCSFHQNVQKETIYTSVRVLLQHMPQSTILQLLLLFTTALLIKQYFIHVANPQKVINSLNCLVLLNVNSK